MTYFKSRRRCCHYGGAEARNWRWSGAGGPNNCGRWDVGQIYRWELGDMTGRGGRLP